MRGIWRALGPGLVTGAADDDPSGIATYSQAGAQFGFALLWTIFLTLPFMAAIQIISAIIGWDTRQGLARNLSRVVPKPVLYLLISALLVANTINIAADLAAMGEALNLVIGGSSLLYAVLFGAVCLIAEVFIPYHRYAGILKLMTLVLLAYVAAAFSVQIPWGDVVRATVVPQMKFDQETLLMIVAVFGTTISPYLFFWQASQEAEESALSHRRRYASHPTQRKRAFRTISVDTWTGMVFSNLVAFFIIVTTAATLHTHGVTHIDTASEAAEALRPIGGPLTFALFALGIIGTGLLAVPVLAGSAAYAVAELFKLPGSLELPVNRAIGFYAIVAAATLGGAALLATKIDPIAMLFWAAVINGIVAVPIMIATMFVVGSKRGIRLLAAPRWLIVLGWLAAVLMAVAVVLLIWSSL
ncbi:divalent metal cation transporter [Pseudolabrys taiwanensis]|uniref:Divalent metal cation transporter n=1 Tax=Pseudolabrys taiwanensis TaxID=331696 RepID=A0A346A0B0_9HYPH|nr:divalent metal cation transporter [Pseudolabrys taiwanensis]AXK82607.1 divalent metal cation transporter [Pseudolabrys taiwanensis]